MSARAEPIFRRHRLTVADYHRMGEAGVFAHDARVELIEGEVIDMAPIGSRHARAVNFLNVQLVEAVRRSAIVAVQNPLVIAEQSEVQPDVSVLRARTDLYGMSHPRPGDVLLLIEVAETTLRYDLEVKLPLYARARIPEVWIVDLESALLRLFRKPQGERYGEQQDLRDPGMLAPVALADVSVDLTGLFGG